MSKSKQSDSVRKGLQEGWVRSTFIIKEEHLEKIKAIAYWDRLSIKDVLNSIFSEILANKNIKPLPHTKMKKEGENDNQQC